MKKQKVHRHRYEIPCGYYIAMGDEYPSYYKCKCGQKKPNSVKGEK